MKVDQNWIIDTEDIDIKNSKLRFYVLRKGTKNEFEGASDIEREFTAKSRINFSTFKSKSGPNVQSFDLIRYATNDGFWSIFDRIFKSW